jgi:YbbR domain-containing protein
MKLQVFDNLALKLISLGLGFALWYMVAGGQGAEIVFPIPLEYRNVPEGLEVIEESVQQADVRLRGSSEVLRRLSSQDIQVSLDLSGTQPEEQSIYLTPDQVVVPFGVRVMRVTPAAVQLRLDHTQSRRVQVVPRVVGSPPEGYELANIWLASTEVDITGPASRLEGLEQITTEPLSVEGLREPFTQTVHVTLEDPYVRLVDARGVDVTLDVREERIRKTLKNIVLTARPNFLNASLSPKSITVEIEGPRSVIEQAREEDLEAELDLEGLEPGTHNLLPQLRFLREELSGIEILSVDPEEVRVLVPESETR